MAHFDGTIRRRRPPPPPPPPPGCRRRNSVWQPLNPSICQLRQSAAWKPAARGRGRAGTPRPGQAAGLPASARGQHRRARHRRARSRPSPQPDLGGPARAGSHGLPAGPPGRGAVPAGRPAPVATVVRVSRTTTSEARSCGERGGTRMGDSDRDGRGTGLRGPGPASRPPAVEGAGGPRDSRPAPWAGEIRRPPAGGRPAAQFVPWPCVHGGGSPLPPQYGQCAPGARPEIRRPGRAAGLRCRAGGGARRRPSPPGPLPARPSGSERPREGPPRRQARPARILPAAPCPAGGACPTLAAAAGGVGLPGAGLPPSPGAPTLP